MSIQSPILITGAAGFIGYHLAHRLISQGIPVLSIDNVNDYYDVNLKLRRLSNLKVASKENNSLFKNYKLNLSCAEDINSIFQAHKPSKVVNLAAQAGVRYSLENPMAYIESNIVGFLNVLEACKNFNIKHLIYASSSSVYGGNTSIPFSEKDSVNHPVSLYAATKKSNELMAHSYSHLYDLPATGLRFFTVYGPWGRPDMALFLFTKAIIENKPIKVYNNGNMLRDFTYIDDIVECIMRLLEKPSTSDPSFDCNAPNPSTSWAPHRIFNIGNSKPTNLMDYIKVIENRLSKKSKKIFLPMQAGDVKKTWANNDSLVKWINFSPCTTIQEGVVNFVDWYCNFYVH